MDATTFEITYHNIYCHGTPVSIEKDADTGQVTVYWMLLSIVGLVVTFSILGAVAYCSWHKTFSARKSVKPHYHDEYGVGEQKFGPPSPACHIGGTESWRTNPVVEQAVPTAAVDVDQVQSQNLEHNGNAVASMETSQQLTLV